MIIMNVKIREWNIEDKTENIRFYTEKCGFEIQSVEMDGNIKVA